MKAVGHPDIAQNLRLESAGTFELPLIPHPAKETHLNALGMDVAQRIEQERLYS